MKKLLIGAVALLIGYYGAMLLFGQGGPPGLPGVWYISNTGNGYTTTTPVMSCVNCTAIPGGQLNAGTVSNAQLDPGTIQYVSKTLTLTQLQTLNSVPFQIVAAPGAGNIIDPVGGCWLELVRGSAAFTGGGTVTIGYDTGVSPAATGTIAATVFTTFAATQLVKVLATAQAVAAPSGYTNKGLYMAAAGSDFASGTGATGVVGCGYRVLTGF